MAIKIKSLEQISKDYTDVGYLYKDLALDITLTTLTSPGYVVPVPGSDIKSSNDLAAIQNSLQNLFNTKPGQRFLFPAYGLNLNSFLFDTINEINGQIIGTTIFNAINEFELRVSPIKVNVTLDPDNNQYLIDIFLSIPLLNINTTIQTVLDIQKQSFIVLPTTKNI
jgi:phage baseplate assembly protein W